MADEYLDRARTLVRPSLLLLAVMITASLVIFPAFKGVWLGYVPLGLAALLVALVQTGRVRQMVARRIPAWGEKRFLVVALIVPPLLQAFLLLLLRPVPEVDALFVYEDALRLAENGSLSELTYYAPAQAFWYALWFRLLGPSVLVAQLSHIPWSMLIVLLTWRVARAAGLNAWSARCATVAVAFYPAFLAYVLVTPYYHYIYTALTLLMVLTWLEAQRSARWPGWSVLGGVAAGAGALTKAILLTAPAQAGIVWALCSRTLRSRRLWLQWSLFVLAMALVMAPWVRRNLRVFGEPVLVCTSGGLVLLSANNPDSNGLYSALPDEVNVADAPAMLAHSRACSREAWGFIRRAPAEFFRLVLLKNLHTWGTETTFAELINIRGRKPAWLDGLFSFAFQTAWAALAFLWMWTLFTTARDRRPVTDLEVAAAVVLWSTVLMYSLYEGGARHHLPVVPLIALLAAAGNRPRPQSGVDGSARRGVYSDPIGSVKGTA